MIWRNNDFDRVNDFVSNPGRPFEDLYTARVQKDGKVELEVSGQRDVQQEIDSWREHTDMAYILRQMAAGTYQPKTEGMYGDFTKAPETMQQAFQMMIDAEDAFYELDLETRNRFDNDFKKWLFSLGDDPDDWRKNMWPDQIDAAGAGEEVKESVE